MIETTRIQDISIIKNKKNCSLTPQQFFFSFLLLGILTIGTSFIFWNIIIFSYALLTTIVVFFFFLHHAKHTSDQEEIIIQQYQTLTLKQIHGQNQKEMTFPIYQVKVILENSKIYLFYNNKKIAIGNFVSNYEYPKYQTILEKELSFRKTFQHI